MFKPDQPIRHSREDVLGRSSFARALGDAILRYQEKGSLVVGLFGAWGSGKTSIVNMALEHLDDPSRQLPKDEKPIIIKFNPWNYSDQNQLISQFFNQLSITFQKTDYGSDAKKAGEKFEAYAKLLFDPLMLIPQFTAVASVFSRVFKAVGGAARSWGEQKSNDLHSLKKELNELLVKLSCKIIIVIDDIDRLNKTEIRQIFQLIKSLGDFHNTIYLLAFDKNVVIDALKEVQTGNGLEYLEKVIQAPFEIPLVSKKSVDRLLFNQLDEVIEDSPEDKWDQAYWGNLYYGGLRYFFNNIRDVTRYINSLRFSFNLVKGEVDTSDFLAITAFQVFEPEVYYGIRDDKHLFSGIFGRGDGTKEQAQKRCDEIIERADKIPQESLKEVLRRMFPKLETVYGNIGGHDPGFLAGWRKQGRICSPDVFDVFFGLSFPEGDFSQKKMKAILSLAKNSSAFSEALLKLNKAGRIAEFLERLRDYVDNDIPEDNIESVITVLMNIGDFFPEPDDGFFRTYHFYDLLKRFENQEERFSIFKRVIETVTQSLWPIVYEVSLETSRHGKYEPDRAWPEERLLVNAEQLETLEQLACEKIKAWASDGRLSKHPKLFLLLLRWKRWGVPEDVDTFVHDLVAEDEGLIDFISSFLSPIKTYGLSDYVYNLSWRIPLKNIEEFVDLNQIEPRVRALSSSAEIERYDDKKKLAIRKFLDTIDGKIEDKF